MIHNNKIPALALCLIAVSFFPPNIRAVEEELTANDLARALGVNWATIIMPGSNSDTYSVGVILEFGDGSKPVRSGMMGPVKGGSKVEIFLKSEGDKIQYSLLSETATSRSTLTNPVGKVSNAMWIGGIQKYSEILYILKGVKGNASMVSHEELKANEFGVRLYIKKKPAEQG